MANPRRKRSRKSNPFRLKRSSNPFRLKRSSFRRRGHRRSNPSIAGYSAKDLLEVSVGGAVGLLGSKAAAQLVLGGSNNGPTGIVATGVAGLVLGYAASKLVSPKAGVAVVTGAGASVALAIWQQYISGTSAAPMSGLGDPDMAAVGLRGLGEFRNASMPMPSGFVNYVPPPPSVQGKRTRG